MPCHVGVSSQSLTRSSPTAESRYSHTASHCKALSLPLPTQPRQSPRTVPPHLFAINPRNNHSAILKLLSLITTPCTSSAIIAIRSTKIAETGDGVGCDAVTLDWGKGKKCQHSAVCRREREREKQRECKTRTGQRMRMKVRSTHQRIPSISVLEALESVASHFGERIIWRGVLEFEGACEKCASVSCLAPV